MESEENKLIGISRPTFNSIVDYLMTKPYGEVFALVQELQQGSQVITVAAQPEENADD